MTERIQLFNSPLFLFVIFDDFDACDVIQFRREDQGDGAIIGDTESVAFFNAVEADFVAVLDDFGIGCHFEIVEVVLRIGIGDGDTAHVIDVGIGSGEDIFVVFLDFQAFDITGSRVLTEGAHQRKRSKKHISHSNRSFLRVYDNSKTP